MAGTSRVRGRHPWAQASLAAGLHLAFLLAAAGDVLRSRALSSSFSLQLVCPVRIPTQCASCIARTALIISDPAASHATHGHVRVFILTVWTREECLGAVARACRARCPMAIVPKPSRLTRTVRHAEQESGGCMGSSPRSQSVGSSVQFV
jgi:hypothetical protein